jgi:pimeloyl-ACP methyl ester carboxylesterase
MPSTPQSPRRQQARLDPNRGNAAPEMIELVDPSWIMKALGGMLALGLLCAYITLCIVFAHTEWQLVLHPSRTLATTPATFNLPFTEVHFSPDLAGQSQLDGWWIPATTSSDPDAPTALLLHGGDGTMADALPQAHLLHEQGFQVLLFDYRGYGRSGGQHPSQSLMQADANAAYNYLLADRHTAPAGLLVYGVGIGGSIAARLCQDHASIAALVLDAPDGDLGPRAAANVRSHIVPVSLLFHENFPLAAPLATLKTPKLLLTYTTGAPPPALQNAANPKVTVELPPGASIRSSLSRFLDAIFPHGATEITPTP